MQGPPVPPALQPLRLLILGINYHPELTGVGKYTGELADWLAQQGHRVEVVTAPPYYPAWQIGPGHRAWAWRHEQASGAGRAGVWRCPLWVPRAPRTLSRLLHLASFALSSLPALAWVLWRQRPQLLMVMLPTLTVAPGALLLARLAGARTWVHVQDFELDAMFGLGMAGQGRAGGLHRLLATAERALLRRFDRTSSITPRMVERLQAKGVPPGKCRELPNWVDLAQIQPLVGPNRYRLQAGLQAADVLVLYAGNMGEKQGLEIVLEAAALLQDAPHIHFLLAGEGATRQRLQASAASLGLQRLHWLPLQPLEQLNELLNAADIHVLPQRADAADLVMPSKLIGMLASGRATVCTAAVDTQLGQVAEAAGVRVAPGDAPALAAALRRLAADPGQRAGLGTRARAHAVQAYSREAILRRFEADLRALLSPGGAEP